MQMYGTAMTKAAIILTFVHTYLFITQPGKLPHQYDECNDVPYEPTFFSQCGSTDLQTPDCCCCCC